MPQTFVTIAAPGVHAALSEEPPVHLLPAVTVMLDDWLVRYSEDATRGKAPVRRIESNRWLLEAFAGAAECKEALCVQIREYEYEYVEGKVGYGRGFVSHDVGCF
jgi:hypothetical protein